MTGSDASLLFKSSIATSVSNLDSYRCDRANLDERKEGWTEVWGIGPASDDTTFTTAAAADDNVCGWKATPEDWDLENAVAQRTKETLTPYPSIPLTLTQYRVAWQEQLVLRIAGVPHVVINSPYPASETTGQLPCLRDVGSCMNSNDSDATPALVGKHNPGGIKAWAVNQTQVPTGSDIVHYLQVSSTHNIDLDKDLTKSQKAHSLAYGAMITSTLDCVVAALRYGDFKAWDEVYRHQCIAAGLDPNSTHSHNGGNDSSKKRRAFFNWATWFQTWSERTVALKELKLSNTQMRDELFDEDEVNVERALAMARRVYSAIETLLSKGEGKTLLNTETLTSVDVKLFAHLSDALCDLHLITVLSEYDSLVKFFQHTFENFFGGKYGPDKDWVQWNDHTNASNAFNHIPIGSRRADIQSPEYKDAIKLMQSVALHCNDLSEAVADVALVRQKEESIAKTNRTRKAGEMFHRWRMHGTLSEKSESGNDKKKKNKKNRSSDSSASHEEEEEDEMSKKNREHMLKLKRDAKNNDELWVSGVILGTIVAYVLAAASATRK